MDEQHRRIRLSEYAELSEDEKVRALAPIVAAASAAPNGQLRELERRIAAFELKHGIGSFALREQVEAGSREETWDICEWLMLLRLRDRLVQARPR